jgi:glucose-6-phosphate isomerase
MTRVTDTATWSQLCRHHAAVADVHLRDLFAKDQDRSARFAASGAGLHLDYSKHRVTDETLRLLVGLAREREVERWRDRMFAGEHVNTTEDRAAWHVALRSSSPPAEVRDALARMRSVVASLHQRTLRGASGAPIGAVVNLGIGGSDLGPRMATRALRSFDGGRARCRFVANVDPADLDAVLQDLDPATTLFVVTSKTFTTLETLDNYRRARNGRALRGDTA